jgi:hypothetical protein
MRFFLNRVLQRVEFGIGMPFGLQLVRYGGGSDFRFVDAPLHLSVQSACLATGGALSHQRVAEVAAEAAELYASKCSARQSRSFPAQVILLAMKALEKALPEMSDMGRGDFWPSMPELCSAAYWAASSWETHVVASGPVPGNDRANMYFHGWLHEASRARGENSEILQPLVGVFCAQGSVEHDEGDGDLLATGNSRTSSSRM